ncbi:MAG: hypothetical protein U0X93_02275 [Anaerolineales bacterium]
MRGTPTIMLSDGTKLRHPLAYANIQHDKIVSVGRIAVLRRRLLRSHARTV